MHRFPFGERHRNLEFLTRQGWIGGTGYDQGRNQGNPPSYAAYEAGWNPVSCTGGDQRGVLWIARQCWLFLLSLLRERRQSQNNGLFGTTYPKTLKKVNRKNIPALGPRARLPAPLREGGKKGYVSVFLASRNATATRPRDIVPRTGKQASIPQAAWMLPTRGTARAPTPNVRMNLVP